MSLFAELKRRNVIKVAGAYLAFAWVVVQATGAIVPALNLPASLVPTVVWIGVIGFPCVLIFSWAYELTPEGLKRESEVDRSQSITHVTSKRLDYIIIGLLVVAIGLFVLQYLRPPVAGIEAPGAEVTSAAEPHADRAQGALPQQALTPAPNDKSIAVLPFTDMSATKDQEYFSDGIAEELLNLLAKIPEFKVAARTSSFSYKGKDTRIAQIGQELNVAHVLEGSVRKAGNTLRITAQLVRAADGYHLWSETYDRPLDDIFAVQDEIAGSVVEQLKIKLLGAAPKAREVNPQAYALFLQARQLRRHGTPEGFEQGLSLMQQALALDPGYEAAWQELAIAYVNQSNIGLRPIDEAYQLGRAAIDKALAIDPNFARAHSGLGWIAMKYDGDLAAAAEHYRHALALEPTNAAIVGDAATLASALGRVDASVALHEWSTSQDPLNPVSYDNKCNTYLAAGRLEDAIASCRTALRLSPGYAGAQLSIGLALLLQGEADSALAEVQKEPAARSRLFGLVVVHHALGHGAESDAALTELTQGYGGQAPYAIAVAAAFRGEADDAFAWLDKAVALRDPNLSDLPVEPLLANIREDPRWLPFLTKLGKAPEQLAAIKFDVKVPQ